MIAPLSNYRYITPLMSVLNMALVAALTITGDYEPLMLWVNWLVAGLLSWGIWHTVARFRLEGGSNVRAIAISWPILTISFNFSYCQLASAELFYPFLIEASAFLGLLLLTITFWKVERCVLPNILVGLIIGTASVLEPHILLWAIFIPFWCKYMRCNTLRNQLGAVTGILLGIWILYCIVFMVAGEAATDGMLSRYAGLWPSYLIPYSGWNIWQWIFLLLTAVTTLAYSMTGLVTSVGQTIRISTTVKYFSILSLLVSGLYFIDVDHLCPYLMLLAILLSLQLTVHQSSDRSLAQEYFILILIACGFALCLVSPMLKFFAAS